MYRSSCEEASASVGLHFQFEKVFSKYRIYMVQGVSILFFLFLFFWVNCKYSIIFGNNSPKQILFLVKEFLAFYSPSESHRIVLSKRVPTHYAYSVPVYQFGPYTFYLFWSLIHIF